MSDLKGTADRAARQHDGDALAVLGWGMRHYFWILVLSVCVLGIAVPLVVQRAPETYQAQAQVGPADALALNNLDPLPRLGESLFRNGSVAEAVRRSFNPRLPRSENVIPQRVNLITAQDNVVLTVVGHASNPEDAANLANVAAETLRDELNNYDRSVGLFTIQRSAVPPGQPEPRLGRGSSIGFGVLAGALVGLGIIGLLLLWRRPVLSVHGAEEATGASGLGQVWLGRTSNEARGLPHLCHTVLTSGCEELLLVGTRKTSPQRHQLTRLLAKALEGRRDVMSTEEAARVHARPRTKGRPSGGAPRLLVAQDASPSQLVARSDRSLAALVVPHGIRRAALVRQVEQYLDGGAAGILLVRNARSHWRITKRASPMRKVEGSARELSSLGTSVNGASAPNGSPRSATPDTVPRSGGDQEPRRP